MQFRIPFASTIASFFLLLVSVTSPISAATLNVADGLLIGASNVDVAGKLYNVEFMDGSCTALFNGCDDEGDFIFINYDDVYLAGLALSSQVIVNAVSGNFDNAPPLTRGCENAFSQFFCSIMTPYASVAGLVKANRFDNYVSLTDYLMGWETGIGNVSLPEDTITWAVWTAVEKPVPSPIPLPSSMVLLGIALGGLGVMRSFLRRA